MIDRFFIGLVTGWVSVLGPLGLRALAFRLSRASHVPPVDPLPTCRARGPSATSSATAPAKAPPGRTTTTRRSIPAGAAAREDPAPRLRINEQPQRKSPMAITESTSIRTHILEAYDHMKQVFRDVSPATDALAFEHIAGAVYEFNRGAGVAALRSKKEANAIELCSDIIENFRLLLVSHFELYIEADAVSEVQNAASQIRDNVLQVRA
jgi:virulence-associated protein VapD